MLLAAVFLCAGATASAQQGGGVAAAAAPAAIATVTSVSGAGTWTAAGRENPLTVGDELPKSAVVTAQNGTVALVFTSGEFVSLESGESLTLGDTPASSTLATGGTTRGMTKQDAVPVADNGVTQQNTAKRWQSQLAYMYGIRGDAAVVAVSPRLVTAAVQPVFVFFDPDSSRSGRDRTYAVRVRDDAGRTVLERQVTARPLQFVEVSAEAALAGAAPEKRYTWSVSPADAAGAAGEATFLVADKESMQLADARRTSLAALAGEKKIDATSQHMLFALYCLDERVRLFADAVPHLLALGRSEQARAFAGRQLGLTLARFGNQTGAIASRATEYIGR